MNKNREGLSVSGFSIPENILPKLFFSIISFLIASKLTCFAVSMKWRGYILLTVAFKFIANFT